MPVYTVCVLLLATGLSPGLLAQQHEKDAFGKTADLPDWHVVLWEQVIRTDIWYFGWYSAPLGDINGDGYDDFAVSSRADTTFIFLGGDPFPHDYAFIVRGGSAGIASADFNRDGRMDLVTARNNDPPGEIDPEYHGAIRIFLQKDAPERFVWESDVVIQGEINERVGRYLGSDRSSVQALDYNGDGWPDIVTTATDPRDSVRWMAVLYLGGPVWDGQVDAEFRVGIPKSSNHSYVEDLLIGDLNGDSREDVLIEGGLPGRIRYWDLFLGNAAAHADVPDRVIRSDEGWAPFFGLADIMDIDSDGFDDILDIAQHKELGDALLFHGRAVLPDVMLPDDSIPNLNPDPLLDVSPQKVCPVGDMNGDGVPDLVMAWNKALAPGGSAYYFYPGGPAFRTPLGYFGTIPENDHVQPGVYPVGDVNGDGFGDVITLGKGYRNARSNCFQVWLGAPQLKTAIESESVLSPIDLSISPNPVPMGVDGVLVAVSGLIPGEAHLDVFDLLGRLRHRVGFVTTHSTAQRTLNLDGLTAGVYFIVLHQGQARKKQTLVLN